ncbi:dTDP-4-dehydrorhamnose reductase [uncultured Dokdonia sp.]|uniref:dTDP-4-dehydrorhamnose reductase n=1 Tax=uncultured Dokdonia sp. TaxID=575653 RepID=UPI0026170AFC|nr:dTDP-4-dehydrorhamnose reductase [uncultured Dokdonia sp.]
MGLTKPHKRLLITGADGQLGCALREESVQFSNYEFVFATKKMLDITSKASIQNVIEAHKPDIIINTAAYTAVDAAEKDSDAAYALNQEAVRLLAEVCDQNAIALIHISTDYVFDGMASIAYTEEVVPNPQTVYGKSKLAGEQAIQALDTLTYAIIRTSWLYSAYGHNFYKTMIRLGKERETVSVVDDQYGIPTLANDLAKAILQLVTTLGYAHRGIYHYSNSGKATWYAFAKAIFESLEMETKVLPVSSEAFPTVATRPKNSILNCTKIVDTFGVSRPLWNEALQHII